MHTSYPFKHFLFAFQKPGVTDCIHRLLMGFSTNIKKVNHNNIVVFISENKSISTGGRGGSFSEFSNFPGGYSSNEGEKLYQSEFYYVYFDDKTMFRGKTKI